MPAGICFHFEDNDRDVWSGRSIDLDAWLYACLAFGVDNKVVVDLTSEGLRVPNIETVKSLEAFEEAHLGERILYLETPWSFTKFEPTKLPDFQHPEDCWYVFGPAGGFRPDERPDLEWLTVPQLGSLDGTHVAMHSVHVVGVVLAHRYWQRGA